MISPSARPPPRLRRAPSEPTPPKQPRLRRPEASAKGGGRPVTLSRRMASDHGRALTRPAALVLGCLVLLDAAARAQGPTEERERLFEREVPFEGGTVTVISYKGEAYRRIDISALRSLAVGSVSLHGLAVCVEGKFDRLVSTGS